MTHSPDIVEQDTRRWVERAVIGLNLCPFAKGVYVKNQVHFAVSPSSDGLDVLQELERELKDLVALEPEVRDTTLLVLPEAFPEFLDFNDFLSEADALLERMGLEGEIQIANFHPRFQFAGTSEDDVTNCTNRSPYPTLHLIRENSIDRAVEAFPEAEAIYEVNMAALEKLGEQGWRDLDVGPSPTASACGKLGA